MDQYTYDLVRSICLSTCKLPVVAFHAVDSVSITGGALVLRTDAIESLPENFERSIFSAVNCTSVAQVYSKKLRVETRRSIKVEIEKTVSSANDAKVGLAIGGEVIKFNADIAQKNSFSLTQKSSQVFDQLIVEEFDEKREIPSKTHLFIELIAVKGRVRAPVSGWAIIDAVVDITFQIAPGGPFQIRQAVQLSNSDLFNSEPKYRTTDIDGFAYGETYQRTDVIYKEKTITDDYPLCKFDPAVADASFLKYLICRNSNLLEVDGCCRQMNVT
ncbi:MAG: hypothetical protein QM757_35550 [Paludibaculum sp.]